MRKMGLVVFILFAAAVAAGFYWLATWDMPPPTERINIAIDESRFPR